MKFKRLIGGVFGAALLLAVGLSFLNDHLTANRLSVQFNSIPQTKITSIQVDEYQHHEYDQSGDPINKSHLFTVTDELEIESFSKLVMTNQFTHWNHFSIIDTYRLSIFTSKGLFEYEGRRTGERRDDLWVKFSGNEGTYVANLYNWIAHESGRR